MKKILFVTNHLGFSDGVAKALLEFVNALDKDRFDITVMPIFKFDKKFAKLFDERVKIQKVFNFYFRGLSTLANIIPYELWYDMLVPKKYDIEVAFQFGFPTKLIAASSNKNAKHIAWIHGYGEEYLKTHEKFDKVVCCSKENVTNYKKSYLYPDRLVCLYNLINEYTILEKAKENLNVNKKYDFTFCAVGRLSPEKGFDRLIRCHNRLIKEGLLHNLWIVGGGAEYEKLNQLICDNDLNDSVILFGNQNNPYTYMANADMLVVSSYGEGFSTVMAEAAILNKSTLSTRVPGAIEFIEDNNVGLVVENDEESLYLGMKEILLNKNKVITYENNIENISDLHFETRLKNVEDFFNNL